MKINIKKTKVMRISKRGEETINITLNGEEIEQVKKFCYLGSVVTEDARCHEEIKRRIALGKDAFYKRGELGPTQRQPKHEAEEENGKDIGVECCPERLGDMD